MAKIIRLSDQTKRSYTEDSKDIWETNYAKLYRKYNPKVRSWSEDKMYKKVAKAIQKMEWFGEPYSIDEIVYMIRDDDTSLIEGEI